MQCVGDEDTSFARKALGNGFEEVFADVCVDGRDGIVKQERVGIKIESTGKCNTSLEQRRNV